MTVFPPATDDVARFVDLIGPEATLQLLEARCGRRLYIADPAEGQVLTEIIGLDAASALHQKFGRGEIKVPLARSWRVLCYIAMGMSRSKAAGRAGCSENSVDDILRAYGRPSTQLDLFA